MRNNCTGEIIDFQMLWECRRRHKILICTNLFFLNEIKMKITPMSTHNVYVSMFLQH